MSTGLHLAIALSGVDTPALVDGLQKLSPLSLRESARGERLAMLYALDAEPAAVFAALARLCSGERPPRLAAAATLAVRVVTQSPGQPEVSEQSLRMACELVGQAPWGRFVLSQRLGSLLQLTVPAVAAWCRPLTVKSGDGVQRALLQVDMHRPAAGTADAGWNAEQPLAELEPDRLVRLADRIAQRLIDDLGPIAPILAENACREAETAGQLVKRLLVYLPPNRAERVRAVVEEELSSLILRG